MKKGRTVLEAKRYEIYSCSPDTSLLAAAERMVKEDISALVVLDAEGGLAGLISRTDLLRAYLASDHWQKQTVSQHMSADVFTVNVNDKLREVARLLLDHQIHRAVVVRETEGQTRPVGVISATDLVYYMVQEP